MVKRDGSLHRAGPLERIVSSNTLLEKGLNEKAQSGKSNCERKKSAKYLLARLHGEARLKCSAYAIEVFEPSLPIGPEGENEPAQCLEPKGGCYPVCVATNGNQFAHGKRQAQLKRNSIPTPSDLPRGLHKS
jgi:hypothetical protein